TEFGSNDALPGGRQLRRTIRLRRLLAGRRSAEAPILRYSRRTRGPPLYEAWSEPLLRPRRVRATGTGVSVTRRPLSTDRAEVTSVDRSDAGWARAAIESLDGGYLVVRAVRVDAQVVDWEAIDGNALAWRLFTGTEGAKPGWRMFARLDETHRAVMGPMLQDALTTGKRLGYRRPITWPDGTTTWRQLVAVGLDADVVALIGYDITAAVDTQSRAAALGEHSTDVVAIAGVDTGLQWVSPSVEHVLGYLPSQLV